MSDKRPCSECRRWFTKDTRVSKRQRPCGRPEPRAVSSRSAGPSEQQIRGMSDRCFLGWMRFGCAPVPAFRGPARVRRRPEKQHRVSPRLARRTTEPGTASATSVPGGTAPEVRPCRARGSRRPAALGSADDQTPRAGPRPLRIRSKPELALEPRVPQRGERDRNAQAPGASLANVTASVMPDLAVSIGKRRCSGRRLPELDDLPPRARDKRAGPRVEQGSPEAPGVRPERAPVGEEGPGLVVDQAPFGDESPDLRTRGGFEDQGAGLIFRLRSSYSVARRPRTATGQFAPDQPGASDVF